MEKYTVEGESEDNGENGQINDDDDEDVDDDNDDEVAIVLHPTYSGDKFECMSHH